MSRTGQELSVADSCQVSEQLLPTAQVAEVGQAAKTGKCIRAGTRSLRVLIVDDDKDTTDSMSMLVRLWGHQVRQAYDGAAALEIASAYRPDVLLLDYAMPGMDGCRLARQLLRLTPLRDSLFIAVTGYGDEAHRQLCEAAGFDHVLTKPVQPLCVEKLLLVEQGRLTEPLGTPPGNPQQFGILVVDDEESMRDVLHGWLRQQGFTVWLSQDGQEALELYWRHRRDIHVILLDVRMPGLDGPRILAALQELNPRIRCCFMSGDLGKHTESSLRDAGAAAVIPKPFRLPEVALLLQNLANRGRTAGRL